MIDIEISLFNEIARPLVAKYPDVYASSRAIVAPPRFPAVTIIQSVNSEVQSRVDTSGEENANSLTYDVNVYSNSAKDGKTICKDILQIVDEVMRNRNFTRVFSEPLDNAADPSIYRMHARYIGLIDKNLVHYRR